MSENSLYFEAIVAHRSLMLDPEEAPRGDITLSLETQPDLAPGEQDIPSHIEGHFPEFLSNLRHLSKQDQELLLA